LDLHFVLRNKPFGKLWAAQMLSATAQHLLNFALIIRVFNLAAGTRFANVSVAVLVLSYGVPSVLFASVAGVYVDHWDRKRVMLVANLLRAFLVLGYFAFSHNIVQVFALSFIIATVTQFFTPAEAASIPALVKGADLLTANSLFVLSFYVTFVLGFSLSAPLIRVFGSNAPFVLATAMFAVAALFSLGLPALRPEQSDQFSTWGIFKKTWRELAANSRMILADSKLYFPIAQLATVQGVLGMILTMAPAIAFTVLGAQLTDTSQYLIVPAGVGMVLGVGLVGPVTKLLGDKQRVVRSSAVMAAASLLALGLVSRFGALGLGSGRPVGIAASLLVALLVLSLGLANAVLSTTSQTILQENTADSDRGKVFGSLNMFMNIASTLPVLVAATLADAYGVPAILVTLGVALTLLASWQLLVARKHTGN
jgi:MFS family permease